MVNETVRLYQLKYKSMPSSAVINLEDFARRVGDTIYLNAEENLIDHRLTNAAGILQFYKWFIKSSHVELHQRVCNINNIASNKLVCTLI